MNNPVINRGALILLLVSCSMSIILSDSNRLFLAVGRVAREKAVRQELRPHVPKYVETIGSHLFESVCEDRRDATYIVVGAIIKVCVNHAIEGINHLAGRQLISRKKHEQYIGWVEVAVGQLLCSKIRAG